MSTTSAQGEVVECEDQGVEIPVVFLTSSEIDEDVVQESGPVEKQATTKNTKEGRNYGSESLRSLEEQTKVTRQSKQASKYSTRLNHAKTSGTRLSLLVASASANTKKRSEPSATTKNSAHDQPEDSVVKDSQKKFTTKVILMSPLAETPRRIKKRKSKRIEDRILADDLSEELTSSIIEDRSVQSKKTTKSRLSLLLTRITSGTRRGDAPSDEKSFDDSTTDTSLLTDDRSVSSSKLSNLVAEHEGEAEQEMNELIDLVLSQFSDQEIKTGLKEQMKSVTLAERAQVYLRTRAEHTLTAIVDEIDSSEIQQAIKSPDAWNDLIGCGAMPHPELLVDNCGAVASIICLNDNDSTKNFHDDDSNLQVPTDGDGLYIDNDSFSDLPRFLHDDDNSSMGDTLEGDPLQDDTLHDALREHNFAKAMECLKKRAVRTGLSEVTLLDAVRAKQASRAREARPPRRSPHG
jgi:hypothetical protein